MLIFRRCGSFSQSGPIRLFRSWGWYVDMFAHASPIDEPGTPIIGPRRGGFRLCCAVACDCVGSGYVQTATTAWPGVVFIDRRGWYFCGMPDQLRVATVGGDGSVVDVANRAGDVFIRSGCFRGCWIGALGFPRLSCPAGVEFPVGGRGPLVIGERSV